MDGNDCKRQGEKKGGETRKDGTHDTPHCYLPALPQVSFLEDLHGVHFATRFVPHLHDLAKAPAAQHLGVIGREKRRERNKGWLVEVTKGTRLKSLTLQ